MLMNSGVMKGKQADIQTMSKFPAMTGALIAAIAQNGADDGQN